jgi:glycosyltransferase involved in cell wall biosynthesis
MFIVPDLRVGGAERHITTLVPRLDKARFEPSVVCIGEEGDLFADLSRAEVDAKALHLGGKLKAFWALAKLIAEMRKTRPDVVIVRGYNAEMLGRLAARSAGVECTIVWVHNIGDANPRSYLRRLADRILIRSTNSYFGVAEAQRDYMVNGLGYPENRVRIIYNGVDPRTFSVHSDRTALADFDLDEKSPVIGIVAALRPEKDHKNLLHAARVILDSLPRVQFLIIGDGPERAALESTCVSLDIARNVRFAGSRTDIGRLLQAIDIFTLSSATVECFPIALLEAMACARPAVCTDVGGVGEIVNHNVTGYLVPPGDPQLLAARLKDLLSNPSAAIQMGIAGRCRIETQFTLDTSVAAAEQAIQAVLLGDISTDSH